MSGHSKWSKIKRQKESNDKEKGLQFAKLSRLITLAVIEGGGLTDPETNVKLRLAITKAKEYNMPKDNIQRAIEKGAGPNKNELQSVLYEAFGPHGIALLIQATTENRNRTTSTVRNILERHGGKLGEQGTVKYLFRETGILIIEAKLDESQLLELSEELEAYDIFQDDEKNIIYFPPHNFGTTHIMAERTGLQYSAEIEWQPITGVTLSEENKKEVETLIELLEENDDIQTVYSTVNWEET